VFLVLPSPHLRPCPSIDVQFMFTANFFSPFPKFLYSTDGRLRAVPFALGFRDCMPLFALRVLFQPFRIWFPLVRFRHHCSRRSRSGLLCVPVVVFFLTISPARDSPGRHLLSSFFFTLASFGRPDLLPKSQGLPSSSIFLPWRPPLLSLTVPPD